MAPDPNRPIKEIRARAHTGQPLLSTFTHPERGPSLDDISIMPTQLNGPRARDFHTEMIATDITIGEGQCSEPLFLDYPILLGAMSIWDLTIQARTALIKAAHTSGLPFNAGEGGLRGSERALVEKLDSRIIHQWAPARIGVDAAGLKEASAVEIKLVDATITSLGKHISSDVLDTELLAHLQFPGGRELYIPPRHLDIESPKDLKKIVELLREVTDHRVPILISIGTANVYGDVRYCVKAGADAIILNTSGTSGHNYPEAMAMGIGLPPLAAITPAVRAMVDTKAKEENVKLIVGGGITTGVDAFKLIAMGADAVSIGTGVQLALDCDRISDEGVPAGVLYGNDSTVLDPEIASGHVVNYIRSVATEIAHLTAMTGNASLDTISMDSLRALSYDAASISGLKLAGYERALLMWEH